MKLKRGPNSLAHNVKELMRSGVSPTEAMARAQKLASIPNRSSPRKKK